MEPGGRILFSKKIQNVRYTELSLEQLPEGCYFVRVVTDQGVVVKKVVKGGR